MEKMICHANTNENKAGVVILILENIYFRVKNMSRDKEGNFFMIKR